MESLTQEQRDFLAECEEELKDRFTEKDEEFMSVYNAERSEPPVVEPWYTPNANNWRNNRAHDRRHQRRDHRDNRDRRGYRDFHHNNYSRRDARERSRPY